MEHADAHLDLERQLHSLRLGLKAVCVLLSLLVFLGTWYSFGHAAMIRGMCQDMGSPALPMVSQFAFRLLDFQIPLLILSLSLFLTVVFCCLRYRSGLFLWMLAAQGSIGLFLMVVLFLGPGVAMRGIIQSMMTP